MINRFLFFMEYTEMKTFLFDLICLLVLVNKNNFIKI